jgi:hypothetical protein
MGDIGKWWGLKTVLNTLMTTVVGTLTKDPNETRIFKMDWSAHLGTLTIANSAWTVPAGLTIAANGVVEGNTKTYLMLSGGTVNTSYIVTNTIVVSGNNEVYERSGRLDVREY